MTVVKFYSHELRLIDCHESKERSLRHAVALLFASDLKEIMEGITIILATLFAVL